MPIPLGVLAVAGAGGGAAANSYELIATVNGTGSSGIIDITNIPADYKHIQLRYTARSTRNFGEDNINFQINNDTANNYAMHALRGNGSAVDSTALTARNDWTDFGSPDAANTANAFAAGVLDILDYANTSKFKTGRLLYGVQSNGPLRVMLLSGLWRSTSAITSIKLTLSVGNFNAASRFSIYGIK
jgi:hypothetical protein